MVRELFSICFYVSMQARSLFLSRKSMQVQACDQRGVSWWLILTILLTLSGQVWLPCEMVCRADDWPQWRGPQRDGTWRETDLVKHLPSGALPLLWRAKISGGYSGPTIADGRVYVSDRLLEADLQYEQIHCFDSQNGRLIWSYRYECPYVNIDHDAGPRAVVAISDQRAYALGAMGDLVCLDAASGTVHWHHDLVALFNIRMPIWGLSCSPLIERDLVILQIGGDDGACLVALDRITGKTRWKALDDGASYSSPLVIEQAGRRVLVCWTGERLVGLDPSNGAMYWQYRMPETSWIRGAPSPVWHKDRLLISGFFTGTMMFRLQQDQPEVELLWHRRGPDEEHTDGIHASIAEPILVNNYIYGVDSFGQLRCLDAKTGDRVWENLNVIPQRRWSTLRLIPQERRVWVFTELGELAIGRISPDGYEETSRAQLIPPTRLQEPTRRDGVCWAYPAFANQCVFARNDKELVCASLKQP